MEGEDVKNIEHRTSNVERRTDRLANSHRGAGWNRRAGWLAVFVLAVAARVAYLVMVDGGRFLREDAGGGDASQYVGIAESVARGEGFRLDGRPTSYRAPLYPLFLAGCMKVSARPLLLARLLQCLAGATICVLAGLVARRLDRRAGLPTAALCALSYELIQQSPYLLTEVQFTLLLLAGLRALMRVAEGAGRLPCAAGVGLAFGLATLTRPTTLLLPLFLAPWLMLSPASVSRLRRLAAWGLMAAVSAAVLLPWTVRNAQTHGAFVLLTTDQGKVMVESFSASATGGTGGWNRRDVDYHEPANLIRASEAETSRLLSKAAVADLRADPWRLLTLAPRKAWNMWRPWYADASAPAQWLAGVCHVAILLLALAALGCRRVLVSLPVAVILFFAGLHVVLFSEVRYRYPVVPLLIALAVVGLSQMGRWGMGAGLDSRMRSRSRGREE